jgi:hypothetical protein
MFVRVVTKLGGLVSFVYFESETYTADVSLMHVYALDYI